MGHYYGAICKECGEAFGVQEGGGFNFHLLHCDQCGDEKSVTMEEMGSVFMKPVFARRWIDKNIPPCSCGGRFTLDAKPRCPKCRSLEFSEDPNAGGCCYD